MIQKFIKYPKQKLYQRFISGLENWKAIVIKIKQRNLNTYVC